MDKIQRMMKFGDQSWRNRSPLHSDGSPDITKGLGLALGAFEALMDLRTSMARDVAEAKDRYSKKALPSEMQAVAARYRVELDKRKNGPLVAVKRAHRELIEKATQRRKSDGMDGAERAIREWEIRERLAAEIPDEARFKMDGTGDAAQRWVVRRYEQAIADEDWHLVNAIENMPSIYDPAIRLTPAEKAECSIRRISTEQPELHQHLADYTKAQRDLEQLADMVEDDLANVAKAAPKKAEPVDDPIGRGELPVDSGGAAEAA